MISRLRRHGCGAHPDYPPRQRGPVRRQPFLQALSPSGSAHFGVSNHRVELLLAQKPLCFRKAYGSPHRVIPLAKDGFHSFQYGLIVVDEKNSPAASGNYCAGRNFILESGRPLVRQLNGETSAGRLHVAYADGTPMFGDDSVADAQAQPGALVLTQTSPSLESSRMASTALFTRFRNTC